MNFKNIIEKELLNIEKHNSLNSNQLTIEDIFIFKSQNYNRNTFLHLRLSFFEIKDDFNKLQQNFKEYPRELILSIYYHYIKKNIDENELFVLIEHLIKNEDLYNFLYFFSFISHEKLNNFIIDKINNKFSNKLFSLFKDDDKLFEIKSKLFVNYYNNNMIESCENLLKDTPRLAEHEALQHLGRQFTMQLKKFDNNDFPKFIILSTFLDEKYYNSFFNKLLDYIPYYFDLNNYVFHDNAETTYFKPTFDSHIQEALILLYRNTYKKVIQFNNPIYFDAIIVLYCVCYELLTEDENNSLLAYLNPLFNEKLEHVDDYSNSESPLSYHHYAYFILLSLKQKNKVELNKIFSQTNYCSHFLFYTLSILSKENYRLISNYFNENFIIENIEVLFKKSYEYQDYKEPTFFYNFFKHLYSLDFELFETLYYKNPNIPILEQIYIKNQIDTF